MERIVALILSAGVAVSAVFAQTPQTQKPQQEVEPSDIIRITTSLVQTDVVVTDKNDQIIKDLKLEDFELYDNGKKQEIKFMEFVGAESPRRTEGERPALPSAVEPAGASGIVAKDLKRVIAFVLDDLNI